VRSWNTRAIALIAALSCGGLPDHGRAASPTGTGFTYQGRLKTGGAPLTGTADFQFSLWDAAGTGSPPTGGNQVGATQAVNSVAVTGGLFTVQLNAAGEFGATAFNGDARWLQIAVRSPAGSGTFTTLSPRQPLSPTPYALQTRGIFVSDNGNVGIGTMAPFGRLHVDSGSNLAITRTSGRSPIFAAGTGAANAELIMGYVTQADDYVAYSAVGDSFLFPSSNAGRTYLGRIPGNVALMTLDNPHGRVGIGVANPIYRLDVRGDGGGGGVAYFQNDSNGGAALTARSTTGIAYGIVGETNGVGTQVIPTVAVWGRSTATTGSGVGVYGNTHSPDGYGVLCEGPFGATGPKAFRIDHPKDPENKYLHHYCAEGPEPQNIYNGVIILDANGSAEIRLPDYFADINRDPRYLLTPIGAPMPNLHVADEIASAPPADGTPPRFRIAGGKAGAKVSWEFKAVRNDRWMQRYGAAVETVKPEGQRGTYQHPELYDKPREMGLDYRMKHPPPVTPPIRQTNPNG